MAARHTFFSFHYQRDIWRASNIRNRGKVDAVAAAGFKDKSMWEEARLKGDAAIHRLIDKALLNTTVTCVLIGQQTSSRKYIRYEIDESYKRRNGVFGVYIHNVVDHFGLRDQRGEVPYLLKLNKAPIYTWTSGTTGADFARWVEHAYLNR